MEEKMTNKNMDRRIIKTLKINRIITIKKTKMINPNTIIEMIRVLIINGTIMEKISLINQITIINLISRITNRIIKTITKKNTKMAIIVKINLDLIIKMDTKMIIKTKKLQIKSLNNSKTINRMEINYFKTTFKIITT